MDQVHSSARRSIRERPIVPSWRTTASRQKQPVVARKVLELRTRGRRNEGLAATLAQAGAAAAVPSPLRPITSADLVDSPTLGLTNRAAYEAILRRFGRQLDQREVARLSNHVSGD